MLWRRARRYERGAQNYAHVERVTQTAFGLVHMISFERMVGSLIGLLNGMQGRTAHHLQLQARGRAAPRRARMLLVRVLFNRVCVLPLISVWS